MLMTMELPEILRCPSPSRWLELCLTDLDTLLLDHAHCEKKAASTVLTFSFRAAEHELAGVLSRLAREELSHFEMVLRELERRGQRFRPLEPSAYAGRLAALTRRRPLPEAMVDSFVVAALIEARSCERLGLLANAVDDPELVGLYQSLHAAEERHHTLMLELGARFGPIDDALGRLGEAEAKLITAGEPWVRMHA